MISALLVHTIFTQYIQQTCRTKTNNAAESKDNSSKDAPNTSLSEQYLRSTSSLFSGFFYIFMVQET